MGGERPEHRPLYAVCGHSKHTAQGLGDSVAAIFPAQLPERSQGDELWPSVKGEERAGSEGGSDTLTILAVGVGCPSDIRPFFFLTEPCEQGLPRPLWA